MLLKEAARGRWKKNRSGRSDGNNRRTTDDDHDAAVGAEAAAATADDDDDYLSPLVRLAANCAARLIERRAKDEEVNREADHSRGQAGRK